jgi:hypothetical protein
MSNLRIPLLPYAGTSGWSGSATSQSRAVNADRDGTTSAHQRQALESLSGRGSDGGTWRELADEYGWHHGTASGVLSVLHKEGVIARLSTSRSRCKVYVLPDYVDGRETEQHGRKPRPCSNCGHTE